MARFELYHDESKEAGYWNGILLAPEGEKARLVALLSAARDRMTYPPPLSLKNVRENKKHLGRIAASWVSIGVAALAARSRYRPSTSGRTHVVAAGSCTTTGEGAAS